MQKLREKRVVSTKRKIKESTTSVVDEIVTLYKKGYPLWIYGIEWDPREGKYEVEIAGKRYVITDPKVLEELLLKIKNTAKEVLSKILGVKVDVEEKRDESELYEPSYGDYYTYEAKVAYGKKMYDIYLGYKEVSYSAQRTDIKIFFGSLLGKIKVAKRIKKLG